MATNLSKNFTLEELCRSEKADSLGLKNIPNATEKGELTKLVNDILQKVRDKCGFPIKVNSGFRSEKVNKAVGGSSTSQHRKGQAADIVALGGHTNKELFDVIYKMIMNKEITVGQLINEYNYSWVHVSLPYSKKNDILDAITKGGKRCYIKHLQK